MNPKLARAVGPVVLCLVLGGALLVGSGAFDAVAVGPHGRIVALEREVRCPGSGCGDLSVAQSYAPSSVALRNEIVQGVDSGQSDSDILATIVARYGTGILLSPPAGGLDTVLWGAPIALAAAAIAGLCVAVVRRRR